MSFSLQFALYRLTGAKAVFLGYAEMCNALYYKEHYGAHFGFETSMPKNVCEVNPAVSQLEGSAFKKVLPNYVIAKDAYQRYFEVNTSLAYYKANKGLIPHKGYLSDLAKSVLIDKTAEVFLDCSDYSSSSTIHTPEYYEWTEDFVFISEILEESRELHRGSLAMLIIRR